MIKKIFITLFLLVISLSFFAVEVDNPAPGFFTEKFGTDFETILSTIIQIILGFSGLVAMAYIILGGYQYVTSAGNDEQAKKGRSTLTNAIIGLVVILLSYVIISIVINAAFGRVG
jgi:uncharacterized protein YqgC (DUF456 family)